MAISITSQLGAVSAIPLLMSYAADRESGNIVHRILGRADPEITLKPLRLRTGSLTCFMGTSAEAHALVAQFTQLGWQRLASTEEPLTNMYFVVAGNLAVTADDETETFTVAVDFQEVLP